MSIELFIEPGGAPWLTMLNEHQRMHCSTAGCTLAEWRAITRHELNLATNRPIIATGHQTLLWHPGILAKYLATHSFAQHHNCATANLIVDQHAEGFGSFDIPIRRHDHTLAARRIELTTPQPNVPMGLHESFDPAPLPRDLHAAAPSIEHGTRAIHRAISAHRNEPNAALQMAGALNDLMQPWVDPMAPVCASSLVTTAFGRTLLEKMIQDPHRCAQLYNKAVRAVPEAGIGPLLVRDDYIELPLWRINENNQRVHAYDHDVENWLKDPASITLMPRALFMTAIIRLVMCDLFVHGTGAAVYDRAMELWIADWLGCPLAPKVIATADAYLPLLDDNAPPIPTIAKARQNYRQLWHDPESIQPAATSQRPGEHKRVWLNRINEAPRRSMSRKQLFFQMHESIDSLRHQYAEAVLDVEQQLRTAERAAHNNAIARRRDWPFPLYPTAMIDELAAAVHEALDCPQRLTTSASSTPQR